MMTLRCTGKLLERMNLPGGEDAGSSSRTDTAPQSALPTTALGDWYATILFTRPAHLILAVSERARLCLLLPARELDTLTPRFRAEVQALLRRIGASEKEAEREAREMSPLAFGPTKVISQSGASVNRSVLGSMNDFTRMVKVSLQLREWTLRDLAEQMCETPCGPLGMRSPNEVARELLRGN